MRRLVLFVLCAGVVQISELVEGELSIPFEGAQQVSLGAPVGWKFAELVHMLVARLRPVAVAQSASAGELLQSGVEQACPHTIFESLVKVARLPELLLDPAIFHALLERA